jgi:hypothetical protein
MASWAPWGFVLLRVGWTGVYAYLVLGPWFAVNLFLAYILNQARKHSEENVLEDKLSTERIADAENRYVEESIQWRDKEAERQRQQHQAKK